MQIITGDIWDELGKADLILIPTNSTLSPRGELVMGAGVAKQAKEHFPMAPYWFGRKINARRDYGIVTYPESWKWFSFWLGAFQTKYNWRNPSPLELIERSTKKLDAKASLFDRIAMPMPGTGLGGLTESDVLPILEKLPDNVFIYKK
ncbi:MAG: hypothetical protein KY445_09675 [Armatimonadetes bacterium]|nr:hypothetical protein [Armatimonadota bacterium]